MARRVSRTEMTMFPFLSVLCSVIGILVLFIVLVLSTRVVIEDERFQAAAAERHPPAAGRPGMLVEGIEPPTHAALRAEIERLTAEVAERKARRDDLVQRLTALEDLLEFKKTELFVPVRSSRPTEFDRPEPVAMVPSGDYEVNLRPIYVEVSQQGYTLHPQRTLFPPLRDADAAPDPALTQLFRDVQGRRNREYFVFLIHPNGVAAFDALRIHLILQYPDIQLGWEPFSREWVLSAQGAAPPP